MVSVKRAAKSVVRRLAKSDSAAVRSTYRVARNSVRRIVNRVAPVQLGWVGTLRSLRWVGPTTLEIAGWALLRGAAQPTEPTRVWLADRSSRARVEAVVTMSATAEANRAARDPEFDHMGAGFVARVDVAPLLPWAETEALALRTWIELGGEGAGRLGWFDRRTFRGSAGHPSARGFGDVVVSFSFGRYRGLTLNAEIPPARLISIDFEGRTFSAVVSAPTLNLTGARLEGPLGRSTASIEPLPDGRVRIAGTVPDWRRALARQPERGAAAEPWHRLIVVAGKREVRVSCSPDDVAPPQGPLWAESGDGGEAVLRDADPLVYVEEVTVELEPKPRVRLAGTVVGTIPEGTRFRLRGRHQSLPVEVTVDGQGAFVGEAALLQSRWGSPDLPAASDSYALVAITPTDDQLDVLTGPQVIAASPESFSSPWFNLNWGVTRKGHLVVGVAPPLAEDEIGVFQQTRLARRYAKRRGAAKDSVYFESFYGRQATCNPFAIDRAIAAEHPEVERFWGVVDRSVWTPEGATPVVEGTRAWWRARSQSRFVVANDWLRQRFVHQPGQVVLQTWHGSMLKRIGLDRPSASRSTRQALLRERDKWDLLLSQNRHSTDIFASAYDWTADIVEEGYPRNDLMTHGDRGAIRHRLGIADDKTVVLYAPTWRDNVAGLVTFLDLDQLSADLGPDFVILLRGHSRTINASERVVVPGVIDVTTYPNVTELFMASDALITDYSSVMFDFSVTGRPMIFHVPDMDDYRDSVRGVYFDLSEVAPGPVLATQDEVLEAIRTMQDDVPAYAERYRVWQDRFNALDDGESAKRVMRRLFDHVPAR